MLEKRIADKIHQIRKNKGLTLAQLGDSIGLSKGLLSRIENNQVSPPIATLSKIARGLEVPIGIFFKEDDAKQKGYAITYRNERKQVIRRGTKTGFTYYSLTGLKSRHLIEPFIVKYPVIKKEPNKLFDHDGEEFLLVLKGEMDIVYGKEKIGLKAGDAIHFDPSTPHRGQNAGKMESECLVILLDEDALKDKR
ncbi:MAG: helix-turn-helix transcriptional regulator [Desulfobacterales bacterium]|nr:XRE family transcriptional regulator [Deltaproteobacteria bacterium]NNL43524.1 helix-turn-helix transcriptional regulator [Desulfobacterales bacterium]